MDRTAFTRYTIAVVSALSQGGTASRAELEQELSLEPLSAPAGEPQKVLEALSVARYVQIDGDRVTLLERGTAFAGVIATMSTPAEILVDVISGFPEKFRLRGHGGNYRIEASSCTVEGGKPKLVVSPTKGAGESLSFSAEGLTEVMTKAGKEKTVKKPKPPKPPRPMTHVDLMRKLVLADASDEEIFKAFKKAFEQGRRPEHDNEDDDGAIKRRIYLYKWRTADRFEDVAKKLAGRTQERKDASAEKKSAKAEAKAAKKAAKAEKTTTPKAEKKTSKKKGSKKTA